MAHHADLERPVERIGPADAFCEQKNKTGIQKQIAQHAQKPEHEPSDFKFVNVLRQTGQAVFGKAEISEQTDGQHQSQKIEDGFATQFFPKETEHILKSSAAVYCLIIIYFIGK
jgi:hypothetical protein